MNTRESLEKKPFDYQQRGNASVVISYHGTAVTTLSGVQAEKFIHKVLQAADTDDGDYLVQLLMAKATGQFKRGNEKHAKSKNAK